MRGLVRGSLLLSMSLALGGCAQVVPVAEGVAQLPRRAVEGTAEFIAFVFERPELSAAVIEIGRHAQCNSSGRETLIDVFPSPEALLVWEQERGVQLSPRTGQLLPGLYAVVELGERNTGGYAVVISRQAAIKGGTLYLKASFLSPATADMASQALTSPCTLLALPSRQDYREVVLVDQSNRERARWTPLAER